MKSEDWVRNPIDRFILARIEEEGLAPMPMADRETLIRRLSFDLTGLPPMPDEVEEFLTDRSEGTYEKLVDRLLASPAHGERWAQHWLDLARFAETDGFEHDDLRPKAWLYRDWVIDALNRDLPYDEFVRLQLAGDELRPGDRQAAIATGFSLCGPDMPDINLPEERRHMVLNEMTSTVGAVFLGLQFGCAQCHDHKYDPISQADFYRLRAFWENVDLFDTKEFGRVLHESSSETKPSFLMIRGDFRRPGPPVEPAFPRIANPGSETVHPPDPDASSSGRRKALAQWLTRPDHPLTTRVIVNRLWQHHFVTGLSDAPSDFGFAGNEPTHPELLDWLATELPRMDWSLKRMHRLMVTSATYRLASRPSGPNWTPEQSPSSKERWRHILEVDPGNELLARQNRVRLEGEAIRDSMLAACGLLSPKKGGPGVMAPLPAEVQATLLKKQWQVSPLVEDYHRRSIYLFVRRNQRYPLLEVFDRPDTNASCPKRSRSTTSPQALMLLNSELSLSCARSLAGLLSANRQIDPKNWVLFAFRRALGRNPSPQERTAALRFLDEQADRLRKEGRKTANLALPTPMPEIDPHTAAALTDFCLAIFNSNEFVYID